MLQVYAGPYANLSVEQQKAITKMTTQRYVEDYYYLSEYLKSQMDLEPGTGEYKRHYEEWYTRIEDAFSAFDETHMWLLYL